jgi:putative transposase
MFNGMLQTLMVKLDPSPEQHKMLCQTMKRFNEACNHIAETVFALHSANKVEIHKTVYYPVREHFGLSAQLTIRAISKVCEAYSPRTTDYPGQIWRISEGSDGSD